MSEFVTYRRFGDAADLGPLAFFLLQNGVECISEEVSAGGLDPLYGGQMQQKDFRLKLRPADFEKADALLQDFYRSSLDALPGDYYLYSFSSPELMEVIARRDEWGMLDFLLARKLLAERGTELSEEKLAQLQEQRLADLSRTRSAGMLMKAGGYGAALFPGIYGVFNRLVGRLDETYWPPVVFSFIAIFTAYNLLLRRTLPNGQQVNLYDALSRTHGRQILLLAVTMLVVWIVSTFIKFFS